MGLFLSIFVPTPHHTVMAFKSQTVILPLPPVFCSGFAVERLTLHFNSSFPSLTGPDSPRLLLNLHFRPELFQRKVPNPNLHTLYNVTPILRGQFLFPRPACLSELLIFLSFSQLNVLYILTSELQCHLCLHACLKNYISLTFLQ